MRNRRGRKEKQNVQSGNYKNIKIYYILHYDLIYIYDNDSYTCTIVPYDIIHTVVRLRSKNFTRNLLVKPKNFTRNLH